MRLFKITFSTVLILGGIFWIFNPSASAIGCTISSAVWNTTSSAVGSTVDLVVGGGADCMGKEVTLDIWQKNDNSLADSITTVKATFDAPGVSVGATAAGHWKVDGSKATRVYTPPFGTQYQFYFVAKCTSQNCGTKQSNTLLVPMSNSSGGCGTAGQPACPPPGENGVKITNFDISPKQIAVGASGKILFTFRVSVSNPTLAKSFCNNSSTFLWGVLMQTGTKLQVLRKGEEAWPSSAFSYSFDFEEPFSNGANGTIKFTGAIECDNSSWYLPASYKGVARSASVTLTIGSGEGTVIPATASQSYSFEITNPLKGGPNDLFDIINIVTQWIMYISIPLAVLFIMYAGFLMLTAGPIPANFEKGRNILKYAILGLAIIFIGKGFVSLIISVIELGGGTPTSQTQTGGQLPPGPIPPAPIIAGVLGSACQQASNCQNGLTCKNTICQNPQGNGIGEPCLNGINCTSNLVCSGPTVTVNGQTLNTCAQPLCVNGFCTNKPGISCTGTSDVTACY